jgi:hypothetical protein
VCACACACVCVRLCVCVCACVACLAGAGKTTLVKVIMDLLEPTSGVCVCARACVRACTSDMTLTPIPECCLRELLVPGHQLRVFFSPSQPHTGMCTCSCLTCKCECWTGVVDRNRGARIALGVSIPVFLSLHSSLSCRDPLEHVHSCQLSMNNVHECACSSACSSLHIEHQQRSSMHRSQCLCLSAPHPPPASLSISRLLACSVGVQLVSVLVHAWAFVAGKNTKPACIFRCLWPTPQPACSLAPLLRCPSHLHPDSHVITPELDNLNHQP